MYHLYHAVIYLNKPRYQIQVLKLESDKNEAQRKFETMQDELQTIQVQNNEVKQENSR